MHKKDIEKNVLYVSHEAIPQNGNQQITLSSLQYIEEIGSGDALEAQYRYHGPRVSVHSNPKSNTVHFESPLQDILASGQSLVLYQKDKVVGGGIIET